MAFIREKRKNKFTQVPNEMLQSFDLSFPAKGLLSTMLSYPDDWKFYESYFVKMSPKEGKDAVHTIIEELKAKGYLTMSKQKRDKSTGRWGDKDWIIHEIPVKQESHRCGFTDVGSTVNGSAVNGKPATTNTNQTNTNSTNTNNNIDDDDSPTQKSIKYFEKIARQQISDSNKELLVDYSKKLDAMFFEIMGRVTAKVADPFSGISNPTNYLFKCLYDAKEGKK